MNVVVNGTNTEVQDQAQLSALLEQLGLTGQRIAVEVNKELVPRSRFQDHQLRHGDQIEIIHAVGGG